MSRAQLTKIRRFINGAGGRGDVSNQYTKDLYATSGQQLPLTIGAGSAKWVADKDGTLVLSPAGVPAMPGWRLATTVADGARLGPELVNDANRLFDSGIGRWLAYGDAVLVNENGWLKITAGSDARAASCTYLILSLISLLIQGVTYRISYYAYKNSVSGALEFYNGATYANLPSINSTPQQYEYTFVKIGADTNTVIRGKSGFLPGDNLWFDNISIKEVIPTWLPTLTDGTPINATLRQISTIQGFVPEYDVAHNGVLVEPAATNKVTCRKVNPVDTANITNSGGGVVTLVDAPAGTIAASGLSNICTSGKVYKSTLSAAGGALISGVTGNLNSHSCEVYILTDPGVTVHVKLFGGADGDAVSSDSIFTRVKRENITPTGVSQVIHLLSYNTSGAFYFIMPELVESPFLTSPIMPAPTNDLLASVTRLANNVSFPTPARLLARPNDFAVVGTVDPITGLTSIFLSLLCFYKSSSPARHFSAFYETNVLRIRKVIGSGDHVTANVAFNLSASLLQYIIYQSSAHGMGVASRAYSAGTWSAWTSFATLTTAAGKEPIEPGASVSVGSRNNEYYFYGSYPLTRVFQIPNLASAALLQAYLQAKAEV